MMDVEAQEGREARDTPRNEYVLPDGGYFAIIKPPPPCILVHGDGGRELLRITPEGEVIAPSLEAASEAARVFCAHVRVFIDDAVERRARALLADETWRALA